MTRKAAARLAFIALGVVVAIGAVEGGAWLALNATRLLSPHASADEAELPVTDRQILADWDAYQAQGHKRFYGLTVYDNAPFSSRFLNVDEEGVRSNGRRPAPDGSSTLTVWVFGSSAVVGIPNAADHETIAAYLEEDLAARLRRAVVVKNYATVGSEGFQDLQKFRGKLLAGTPDYVVFVNGHNDLLRDFYATSVEAEARALWEFHNARGIIFWPNVQGAVQRVVPHAVGLSLTMRKALRWQFANLSRADWRREYIRQVVANREGYRAMWKDSSRFFLATMEDALDLAHKHGVRSVMAHQPTLYTAEKRLSAHEERQRQYLLAEYFALPEETVRRLDRVPWSAIDRLHGWRLFRDFREAIVNQMRSYGDLCARRACAYLDGQRVVDQHHGASMFFDWVHLSAAGNKAIAQAVGKLIAAGIGRRIRDARATAGAPPGLPRAK